MLVGQQSRKLSKYVSTLSLRAMLGFGADEVSRIQNRNCQDIKREGEKDRGLSLRNEVIITCLAIFWYLAFGQTAFPAKRFVETSIKGQQKYHTLYYSLVL